MKLRNKLTYANVVSSLALFMVVAGGSAYAASHLITGKQIKNGSITAADIKSGSLLKSNFKKGQIPAGAPGAPGAPGAAGAAGPAGTAVAYGIILTNGTTGNASFTLNVGFPGSVRNPAAGVFCIGAPAGLAGLPVALTVESPGFIQQNSANTCNAGEYEIHTFSGSTGAAADVGFSIIVP